MKTKAKLFAAGLGLLGLVYPFAGFAAVTPSITTQPTNQTVLQDSNATFTVVAGGQTPLFYQWTFNGSRLTNSAHITGATNASLTILNVSSNDAGNYQVTVTNSHGSVTSSVVTLTVLIPAFVTSSPSDQAIVLTSNATFAVSAGGTAPLRYQWQHGGTNLSEGGRFSGTTNAILNISAVQTNDGGAYRVIVTNSYGSATSAVATLSVLVPPFLTTQPSNQTVIQPYGVTFAAAVDGTQPMGYQWYFGGTPLVDNGRILGSTTTNLQIFPTQTNDAGSYQLVITNVAGTATSVVANLTVLVKPQFTLLPSSQTVHAGETAVFNTYVIGTAPLYYQWYFNGSPLSDDGHRSGSTTTNLTISNVQAADVGEYALIATNAVDQASSTVVTLDINLALADTFDPRANSTVNALAETGDGRVLVGGTFTNLAGTSHLRVARLLADGSSDTSYSPSADATVYTLAVQSNTQALVGGDFINFSGQPTRRLGRLNSDGGADGAYNPWPDNTVRATTLQPDGQLLVGGLFNLITLTNRPYLARLQPSSFVDYSFNPALNGPVNAIAVQPDGKILIGGSFSQVNGSTNRLARLNPNGTLDGTFQGVITAGSSVNAIMLQADGRILIGGIFAEVNGQPRVCVARLETNGVLDTTFRADVSGNLEVDSFSLQADGKIFVGGRFSGIGGKPRPGIARLLPDGSVDPKFYPSSVFATVLAQSLQADGKLVLGGSFSNMGEQSRTNIARLNPIEAATQSLAFDSTSVTWLRSGSATEIWRAAFDYTTNGVDWIALADGTRIAGGWQLTGLSLPPDAIVRARGWVCGSSWFVESYAGKPIVVSQPYGYTVYAGTPSASFSVTGAGGTPLYYQWLKNGVPLTDVSNVFGSQTYSLLVTNVYGAEAGQYQVVLSNGWGSVTSAVATLTVIDPVIWSQTGNQYINAGQNATFSVSATGTSPLLYQWRLNGAPISSGTNASLAITNAQASDAGRYTVVVSNQWGALTTAVSTLTVNFAAADAFAIPPASISQWALQPDGKILAGGAIGLAGNNPKYLARFNPDGSADAAFNISNVTVDISSPYAIGIQPDGQLLVAGSSRKFLSLWRLNPDGSTDNSFSNALSGVAYSFVLQADHRLPVAGSFTNPSAPFLTNVAILRTNGAVDTNLVTAMNGTVFALAQQPDGKFLIGGSFTQVNGQTANRLARLNTNGVLDTSFAASVTDGLVQCLIPQPDGKIVFAGTFSTVNGSTVNRIGRVNADGTLDASFNPNLNGVVYTTALQTDGRIVVGGSFTSVSGLTRNRLARLNADGSLDLLFNPNANGTVSAVGLQPDGALLAAGSFTQIAGVGRTNFARLASDGSAAQTLSYDGATITWLRSGASPEVWRATFESSTNGVDWTELGAGSRIAGGWQLSGISLPPTTRIRARGFVQAGENTAASWFVESSVGAPYLLSQPASRTNRAGTTATFWAAAGGSGPLTYRWLKNGAPLADGGNVSGANSVPLVLTNVLGGDAANYSVIVSNSTGSVTSSVAVLVVTEPIITAQPVSVYTNIGQNVQFTVGVIGTETLNYQWRKNGAAMGAPSSATLTLLNVQSNDLASYSVVVSSSYGSVTSSAAALTLNFILPDGFAPGLNDEVRSIATQPDGKIYVGGNFDHLDGDWFWEFGRLNADGSRDTNFFGHVNSSTDGISVQPDGNILVGGWSSYANDWPHSRVCRFYPDGNLDPGVNPTFTGSIPYVDAVVPQADGKILVGGSFGNFGGQSRTNIGRLNADGSLDTFNPGANGEVMTIAVQPDGNIIAAGNFTTLGGQARNRIGRLNTNGVIDAGFNPNANSTVNAVVVQPDGKILVGGSFTSIAGTNRTYLARLNSDGSIDPTLSVSLTGGVSSIVLLADGSIIVAGVSAAGGQTRYGVAHLSATGAVDANWSPQVVGGVGAVSAQTDGKILIGGYLSSVCGLPRSYLARLNAYGPADHSLVCDPNGITWWRSGASPEVTGVQFQISTNGTNWTTLGAGARVNGGWRFNTSALTLGAYVRAYGFAGGGRWNDSFSLIADVTMVATNAQPVVLTGTNVFGFNTSGTNAGFNFTWQAITGQTVIVEASTNLLDWVPLQTNMADGNPALYVDPEATGLPARYYRLRIP